MSNGGRVEPFKNFKGEAFGPARVWHKHENIPGLAMSRSIGDLVAVKVGVNADPEILVHKLSNVNKYMLIASDGVWEFLSNQQVIDDMIINRWLRWLDHFWRKVSL